MSQKDGIFQHCKDAVLILPREIPFRYNFIARDGWEDIFHVVNDSRKEVIGFTDPNQPAYLSRRLITILFMRHTKITSNQPRRNVK